MLLAVADITLQENSPDNVVSTQEVFGGKKVVLFGVPGNSFSLTYLHSND
jgi:peroxiredoxin